MRQTRPVARKATKLSLDDEIARLRDLDLHGLRARWQSTFRHQPPSHLPRHLLLPFLPTGSRPMSWAISIRLQRDC
jgi:hypothetical protein